jgi:predicted DNA-binding transcriptional regulator YafY
MIVMDSKAQLTVDIIAKVVEGRITIANAAKLLCKSRRSIERYVKRYQQVGIQFAVHGNSGKSPLHVPAHSDHPFRFNPISDFGLIRALISELPDQK